MKKIAGILAVAAVVLLGVVWHRHQVKTHALTSGEVYVRDQPSSSPAPLPEVPQQNNQIAETATSQPPAAPTQVPSSAAAPPLSPPATDSIPRNPPNGLAFAGSGKFQLYRQGDITWRLDTQTGDACILFATDTQWRHPRVFQAGCGTRGETTVASGY